MPPLKEFYFSKFEDRKPPAPLVVSIGVEFIWQVLAICSIGLGLWYLIWRWTSSLNMDALWFSVPVVLAETCAYVGLLLFFYNLWSTNDVPKKAPPACLADVAVDDSTRVLAVDFFIPTYSEDPELVRYSIRDAAAVIYPKPIDIRIHVLDDGNRLLMKRVSKEEGVNYITRENNVGFKAGNLRNGMEQTTGDFMVILDADTRAFPTILENTLGYFRDPKVAWVQTPQWFYDIPEGRNLESVWSKYMGRSGAILARGLQRVIGPIWFDRDPFISDPKLFYDVILRRRNRVNASFCCGAGSIHRRNAIMGHALKDYSKKVEKQTAEYTSFIKEPEERALLVNAVTEETRHLTEVTPYQFHVSEDIYTSILLHSDPEQNYKSVFHPDVESKMLSPQDLKSWTLQRFKYAGGSLDILAHDNRMFTRGLSAGQKAMYGMTFYSYLTPLWNVVFIAAPILALFTGISPVEAYTSDFFLHLLPFLIIHELASMFGTWGVDNRKGRMLNLAFFWINLQAIWTVVRGREVKFKVTPKEREDGTYLSLVIPQLTVIALTVVGLLLATMRTIQSDDPAMLGTLVVNGFWALINAYSMTVLVSAALWKPDEEADIKNLNEDTLRLGA